jgi:hypothetical protein
MHALLRPATTGHQLSLSCVLGGFCRGFGTFRATGVVLVKGVWRRGMRPLDSICWISRVGMRRGPGQKPVSQDLGRELKIACCRNFAVHTRYRLGCRTLKGGKFNVEHKSWLAAFQGATSQSSLEGRYEAGFCWLARTPNMCPIMPPSLQISKVNDMHGPCSELLMSLT